MKYIKFCIYSIIFVCLLVFIWVIITQSFDFPPLITFRGSNYCVIMNSTPNIYYHEKGHSYQRVIDDIGLKDVYYYNDFVCAHYCSIVRNDSLDYYYLIYPDEEFQGCEGLRIHNIVGPFESDSLVFYLKNVGIKLNNLQRCVIPPEFGNLPQR